MLPGNNFGMDDNLLIARIAFVDFNGGEALKHFKINSSIDNSDFIELFPNIIDGIQTLKEWVINQA